MLVGSTIHLLELESNSSQYYQSPVAEDLKVSLGGPKSLVSLRLCDEVSHPSPKVVAPFSKVGCLIKERVLRFKSQSDPHWVKKLTNLEEDNRLVGVIVTSRLGHRPVRRRKLQDHSIGPALAFALHRVR